MSREGTVETLNHLEERLTSYGVNYRSFTEQYLDSTGVFKEAVIGILAAVAKQEHLRLSERTIAGLRREPSLRDVLEVALRPRMWTRGWWPKSGDSGRRDTASGR